jgi:hypothetical protein
VQKKRINNGTKNDLIFVNRFLSLDIFCRADWDGRGDINQRRHNSIKQCQTKKEKMMCKNDKIFYIYNYKFMWGYTRQYGRIRVCVVTYKCVCVTALIWGKVEFNCLTVCSTKHYLFHNVIPSQRCHKFHLIPIDRDLSIHRDFLIDDYLYLDRNLFVKAGLFLGRLSIESVCVLRMYIDVASICMHFGRDSSICMWRKQSNRRISPKMHADRCHIYVHPQYTHRFYGQASQK